jgi:hypothetical protein
MDKSEFDRDSRESPSETAHKRGLMTGLVVGVIGGAILGGIVVGLVDPRQPQAPAMGPGIGGGTVPTGPATAPRDDRVWGTAEPEFGPGRVDRDEYQRTRDEESQRRLEGPGATPGTQPSPR